MTHTLTFQAWTSTMALNSFTFCGPCTAHCNLSSNQHPSMLHPTDLFQTFPCEPVSVLLIPCSLAVFLGGRSFAVGSLLCSCKNAHSWFFTCFGQTFSTIFTFSSHTQCFPDEFEGMHHIPVLLLGSLNDTSPVVSFGSASQNVLAFLLPPN